MGLVAPEHRRQRTLRRRWEVRREDAEELADPALGREVCEPDRAAGPADPEQFARDCLMVGREHGAERGRDDVELAVGERERLRVGDDPLDVDAPLACLRSPAARLSGVRSEATTFAPASAARIATLPVPAATSSTLCPDSIPQASTSSGPTLHTICFANRW